MGQDPTISGAEHNAVMSYSKTGLQRPPDVNNIGRKINLFNGTDGIDILAGLNGGMEVNGKLFPWDLISFGFKIGVVGEDPSDPGTRIIDNSKVTIFSGNVFWGTFPIYTAEMEELMTTPVASDVTVLEITSDYEDSTYDYIYAELEDMDTIDPTVTIVKHSLIKPTVEVDTDTHEVTLYRKLLYTFTTLNDEAVLIKVHNFGDVYFERLMPKKLVTKVWWDTGYHRLMQQVEEYFVVQAFREGPIIEEVDGEVASGGGTGSESHEFFKIQAEPCPEDEE